MYLWAVYNSAGERLATLTTGRSYYVFDDGSRVQIDEQPVWCGRCRAFRTAEGLLSPDQTKRQLELVFRLRFPDEDTAFLRDALRRQQEEVADNRARWFRYLASCRTSPPRCLTCGSSDLRLVFADWDTGEWVEHPIERTRIRIGWAGHADHTVEALYTTEGVAIAPSGMTAAPAPSC